MTGSYLGKRKVMNVGGGVMYQTKATLYQNSTAGVSRTNTAGIPIPTAKTIYHDMLLMGVEVFYESPLNKEKGIVLSLFGGFFRMDYCKNYLRMNRLMNPVGAFGATNANGAGNAYPKFGTGYHAYLQAAYLFKKDFLGDKVPLQPFATVEIANYKALKEPMQVFDVGFNWLINGHKSKISHDYKLRPIYGLDQKIASRTSSLILQCQNFI